MFRTISSQIMLSKRVFSAPAVRSFHAAVVTTAPKAFSTEAAAPKVKTPKVKAPKAPKEPKERKVKVPKQKIVKEAVNIKVADGEVAFQPDLADGIEQLTGLPRKSILACLSALPEVVAANILAGKNVRISGLGVVKKVLLKGRTYRNIHTNQPVEVGERDGVRIRVSAGLKRIYKK